jgi:hypothetical protein
VQQFKEAGIIMQTRSQPMFRNGTAANKYSFTGYFGAGNFKLISTRKLGFSIR